MNQEDLIKLMDSLKTLDKKIEQHGLILEMNKIGMKEPLVDVEGFPRNDVDVPAVRKARHDIICLQNERKSMMEVIEKGLHEVHQKERANVTACRLDQQRMDTDDSDPVQPPLSPFAIIESVQNGMLADQAGLQVGDRIVQIGTLSARNFKSLVQIKNIVTHSLGQNIRFQILRPNACIPTVIDIKMQNPGDSLGISFKPVTPPA